MNLDFETFYRNEFVNKGEEVDKQLVELIYDKISENYEYIIESNEEDSVSIIEDRDETISELENINYELEKDFEKLHGHVLWIEDNYDICSQDTWER